MAKKHRVQVLLYGAEILSAIEYDEMLHQARKNGFIVFEKTSYPPSETEQDVYRKFMHLKTHGYIDYADKSDVFRITEHGKIFLSKGGFTAEAKTSKHALKAFTVSIISLLVAAGSFLYTLLCRG